MAVLADRRSVRVGVDPVLIVEGLVDARARAAAEFLRQRARSAGLEGLFLIATAESSDIGARAGDLGVDAIVPIHPAGVILDRIDARPLSRHPQLRAAGYNEYALAARQASAARVARFPADQYDIVLVGWDATPAASGVVLAGSTPELYGEWLRTAVAAARDRFDRERRFVFVASWNDWNHGAHLEPDFFNEHRYLEQTRASLTAPALMALP